MATSSRPKSFIYQTSTVYEGDRKLVLSAPNKPNLSVSTPPEFNGPEGHWTPEQLYVASIETCLMFTFLALARSRKLDFTSYSSTAEGLLEPVCGKLVLSKITVKPLIGIRSNEDREKADIIVGKMEKQCFISNSIESDVVLEAKIMVAE